MATYWASESRRVSPEQDCEQGGCFALPGYQKAAGPPGA
uniref:Uncharacterized protein n=1 Tax=Raoultella planticola TaxID=575 RepID=W8CU58_RAOPL|nr:hypothetical protein pKpNDM1_00615 [Raoultella planticola]QZX60239.1 hypothetical protein [Klebsiella michiganensis]UGK55126.1 Hypothetical protein [Raoultella ornithinolytica]UWX38247.1 Phosphatidate cytidylyltransferase [Klebsiella quasipneumoniae]UMW96657.1 hypothetical protein [Raoultella ornithinolytica]